MPAPIAEAIARLDACGQSVWLDALRRDWIANGQLGRWVDDGIRGVTSNPSIFDAALASTSAYDDEIGAAARGGDADPAAVFDALTLADIRAACDVLRPLWDRSGGRDGWVSHEIDPALADDAEATVVEVQRVWRALDRPNAMIKIPATAAGIQAIRSALAEGIPVNATLVFARCQHDAVADAYLRALEDRLSAGLPLGPVASVISVFLARLDADLAARLADAGGADAALAEAATLANARGIGRRHRAITGGSRFARLARYGARPQRVLFASTAVKDAARPPLTFVAPLAMPETITTLPLATLEALPAFRAVPEPSEDPVADAALAALGARGIDLEHAGCELARRGVVLFQDAHRAAIQRVADALRARSEGPGARSGG